MVKRTKNEFETIEAFNGVLQEVEIKTSEFEGETQKQIHMAIEPSDPEIVEKLKDSKTGMLHNFIRISPKTGDDNVPEGSNLDGYLTEIESVIPEAKESETFIQAFELLKGKNIKWVYKKIGRSFKGYEGKSFYTPQQIL